MGISNFTRLMGFLGEEEQWNEPFDSILIDAQSLLYVAIDHCFPFDENIQNNKTHESRFIRDVSFYVQKRLSRIISDVFKKLSTCAENEIVIVCSFDGKGVPMKWPTQRKRRTVDTGSESGKSLSSGKNLYRVSLFGNNLVSARVRDDLLDSLKSGRFHERFQNRRRFPQYMRYVVSGCDVDGEGEHKIFHLAETLGVKSPVVVSVDNDAFLLAFVRIENFRCVQLYRDPNHSTDPNRSTVYNLTKFVREDLKIPIHVLVYISFLLGNDFVPPVLTIKDSNVRFIADALVCTWETFQLGQQRQSTANEKMKNVVHVEDMPSLYTIFLHEMKPHMRYEKVIDRSPPVFETLAVSFWTVCLWILDYYRLRDFPQKLAANSLWDDFDRNALLVVLSDQEKSTATFCKALDAYRCISIGKEEDTRANDVTVAAKTIFDSETFGIVSRFLLKGGREHEGEHEGFCHDIKISTSKRRRGITNEIEKTQKKEQIENRRK